MKWDTKQPCESCPYRRDAKLEFWHPDHFKKLLQDDRNPVTGPIYGCHATRKREVPSVCAGWLLNQKSRREPSIQLRLALMRHDEAVKLYEEISAGGLDLYDSIEEMVEANFPELLEE